MVESAKTSVTVTMDNQTDITLEIDSATTIETLKQMIHKQNPKYPFPDQ